MSVFSFFDNLVCILALKFVLALRLFLISVVHLEKVSYQVKVHKVGRKDREDITDYDRQNYVDAASKSERRQNVIISSGRLNEQVMR